MSDKKSEAGLDPDLVRELAAILRDTGLTEIEIERGELKLRLTKSAAPQAFMQPPPYAPPAQPAYTQPYSPQGPFATQTLTPAPAAEPAPAGQDWKSHPGAVLSPMVGTVYLSPEPGAANFVKPGDMVAEGQTLMIVEAMKTFNPIAAPRAGRIAQLLVSDAQPVEYGEALVILE
jgi:acetyl-CoA carboxylase biotin carboxyl carrier protein